MKKKIIKKKPYFISPGTIKNVKNQNYKSDI